MGQFERYQLMTPEEREKWERWRKRGRSRFLIVFSGGILIAAMVVAAVVGILLAYQLYVRRTDLPGALARMHEPLYRFLLNKWYFDEIYEIAFVRAAKWLGRLLWLGGDGRVIDGFGPDGVSARVLDVTARVVKLQSGYLYHYAFAMLIGVAALVTLLMFNG